MKHTITLERLRELLHYDPVTGIFTWRVKRRNGAKPGDVAGYRTSKGYIRICLDGIKAYGAHSLAMFYVDGEWPKDLPDHINGDGSDNRIDNLRPATQAQNNSNRGIPAHNSSGAKGVRWHKGRQRWRAQIGVNGKEKTIGEYRQFCAAIKARRIAEIEHFGQFSRYDYTASSLFIKAYWPTIRQSLTRLLAA